MRPIRVGVCEKCHTLTDRRLSREAFPGIAAHAAPFPALCIDCHLGHAQRADAPAHAQRRLGTVTGVRGDCHDVAPPAPNVSAVLKGFSGQWRAHPK